MASALAYVEGGRDFAPFAGAVKDGRSTRRRIHRTEVWQEGAEVHMEIEGNAFLPQQVRRMAGAVLAVGSGTMAMEAFEALADSSRPGAAERVLPARGLCLRAVRYREFPADQNATTANNNTHPRGAAQT
jgi:tRNA pseudouridine38-40 synthase